MTAPSGVALVREWRDEARAADKAGYAGKAATLRECAERLVKALQPPTMTECESCAKRGRVEPWCTTCDGWGIV